MAEFQKLQTPLTDGEKYYYPVTTYDQIIMPDGVSRWDGTVGGGDSLPEDWAPTMDNIEGLSEALQSIIDVSNNEPEDKNTELWINPDAESIEIPQINDSTANTYDTYSSQKIENMFSETVAVERNGTEEPGLPAPNDADTLGGIPAEDYALKTDIPDASSSLPSGGTPGQVLSVISDDGEVAWVDASADTTVNWSEIQNVPSEFTPAEHTHGWDDIENKPTEFTPSSHEHSWEEITEKPEELTGIVVEEWTFTLDDGTTVTKKVLTNA